MKKIQIAFLVLSTYITRYTQRFLSRNISVPLLLKKKIVQKKGLIFFLLIPALIGFISYILWPKIYLGNVLSQGIIGVYTPANLPPHVASLLSDSLVSLDKSGKPYPNLAASWQVNNNATLYTFKLKDNLYWTDGSKIKAGEIKFNLPDVEVSYPNDQTIEFKLADSFSPFPSLLINPVFKNNTLIGTGRYHVLSQSLSKGVVAKLVLAPTKKADNLKSLPKIIFRFYPDEKTARTAFELGEVDSLEGLVDVSDYSDQPSVIVQKNTNFNKIVAVFYNTKDPILSDKNLRKALSFAVSPIKGEERAKTSVPAKSWAFNEAVKDYLGDADMAKSYLDKVQNGKDSTLVLTTTPALSQVGEAVIESWKALGLKAVLRVESGVPQNFQALLMAEAIPADPDQYALWHSTQAKTNISHYSSPRIDKDLEDARKDGNSDTRREKYLDFQKVLLDDSPATFLYFPKSLTIYRKKVEANLGRVVNL